MRNAGVNQCGSHGRSHQLMPEDRSEVHPNGFKHPTWRQFASHLTWLLERLWAENLFRISCLVPSDGTRNLGRAHCSKQAIFKQSSKVTVCSAPWTEKTDADPVERRIWVSLSRGRGIKKTFFSFHYPPPPPLPQLEVSHEPAAAKLSGRIWSARHASRSNVQSAGPPWFEFLVIFYFLHHGTEEVERHLLWKIHKKFKGKGGQMCHRSCSLA